MELKHKYWLRVFVGSICYKPSWKGSRALDTWRNVPDKLWAVAVLVPKPAGLEIYRVNRIQQLEWWALQLEEHLFKNNWFTFAALRAELTSPAMEGGTWWWPELLVITPWKEDWPYSPTTATCQFSFLLSSYDKNKIKKIHNLHRLPEFLPIMKTLWSPSLPAPSSCLDGESMKAEWWFESFLTELFVGSSGSGGAPSGWSAGQDIYQQHCRLPC